MKLNNFTEFLNESTWNLNEAKEDIGSIKIPSKDFAEYMKEYAKEILQAKRDTSKEDWPIAQKVAKYLKSAKTPTTVDEYIDWHNGAKAITGGKSFGMGSGFAKADDGAIMQIITDDPKITSAKVDKWDAKIFPYIAKNSK